MPACVKSEGGLPSFLAEEIVGGARPPGVLYFDSDPVLS